MLTLDRDAIAAVCRIRGVARVRVFGSASGFLNVTDDDWQTTLNLTIIWCLTGGSEPRRRAHCPTEKPSQSGGIPLTQRPAGDGFRPSRVLAVACRRGRSSDRSRARG